MFTYQAFGLAITSEIECPELLPGKAGLTDVYVRCGPVPEHLENAVKPGILCELGADRFLLKLDGVARYLICVGSEIVIDAVPKADPAAIRLFLLGPVFGALLHQRGILPLHGSAISTSKGAVL